MKTKNKSNLLPVITMKAVTQTASLKKTKTSVLIFFSDFSVSRMCWEGVIPQGIQGSNCSQHLHQLFWNGLGKELEAARGYSFRMTQLNYRHDFGQSSVLYLVIQVLTFRSSRSR